MPPPPTLAHGTAASARASRRPLPLWLFVPAALAVSGCESPRSWQEAKPSPASSSVATKPHVLRPFRLTGSDGSEFSNANLRGHFSWAFFGFCPDICPTTLSQLKLAYNQLNPNEQTLTDVLFVSVDPTRDTSGRLRDYLRFFHSDFSALSGTGDQLKAFVFDVGGTFLPMP